MSHATENATLSPEAVDHALLNYQREIDTPTLNNILINFQLERLVWLRAQEAKQEAAIPSIDSAVRTVDSLLKRRERAEGKAPAVDDVTAEEDKGIALTDEEFQYFVKVYAENAYGPRDPDESPERAAVRTSMRRTIGLPDEPDEEEKRMFPGAHDIAESSSSAEIGALPVPSSTTIKGEPTRAASDVVPIDAATVPVSDEASVPAAQDETIVDAPAQPEPDAVPEPQERVPIELPSYVPPWFNDPNVDYMEKRRWLKGRSGIATFDFGSALAKARRSRSTFDSS